MTNEEVKGDLLNLARAMTTQANKDVGPKMNALKSTTTSRLRDIVRMNHPAFLFSKVGEHPQAFMDEVYKVVQSM